MSQTGSNLEKNSFDSRVEYDQRIKSWVGRTGSNHESNWLES